MRRQLTPLALICLMSGCGLSDYKVYNIAPREGRRREGRRRKGKRREGRMREGKEFNRLAV